MMARLVAEGWNAVLELREHLQLIPPLPAGLPFEVKRVVVSKGYDGKTCWVHPRAGAIPGKTPGVVLTMQKLLTGSDVFSHSNETRSDDLGAAWSPIMEPAETTWDGTMGRMVWWWLLDFTPVSRKKRQIAQYRPHSALQGGSRQLFGAATETAWSVYDAEKATWTPWTTLDMPKRQNSSMQALVACSALIWRVATSCRRSISGGEGQILPHHRPALLL
ncbi:MAG: hypothetical protein IPK32_23075 [Verrucomicrobiaceae bacterium]|nr:hypothetical protein [Verrucomicrobiaceae bacterium]